MPHAPQLHHRRVDHKEERPKPTGHDWGQPKVPLPKQRQIQEEVKRLLTEQLLNFQCNEATNDALRRDMTNISMSPFMGEIERTYPPHEFAMPHFTPYNEDEDPDQYLKHYCSTMILYWNNDALI
ncbi:hypothetical protein COP1_003029 [Malus domestica]